MKAVARLTALKLTLTWLFADATARSMRGVSLPYREKNHAAVDSCDLITPTTCGPRVIIGGAMKCGTNSVGDILSKHPDVHVNRCSGACSRDDYQGDESSIWETHYFTHKTTHDSFWCPSNSSLTVKGLRGCHRDPNVLSKYAHHLGGGQRFTFEKSPSYLDTHLFPGAPQRVREVLPTVKLIFTVCEPAERLYSEYNHLLRYKGAKQWFSQVFLDASVEPPGNFTELVVDRIFDNDGFCREGSRTQPYCNTWRDNFLRKGEYEKHISDWLKSGFKLKDILIIDMTENPSEKAKKILKHVGLSVDKYPFDEHTGRSFINKGYNGRSSAWKEHPVAMKMLTEHYALHNRALMRLVRAPWPMKWGH